MRTERISPRALVKLLRKQKIATLPELMEALDTHVKRTIFRKLKQLSYRTSYSHRGCFYTLDDIDQSNRQRMQMNPPLRTDDDRRAMLEALRDGTIDYLATDHAPHTLEEKADGVSGLPHLDTLGAFVTWLLAVEDFTPEQVARFCCEAPGEFVEPYTRPTRFGRLEPGCAASLTVLNLARPTTVLRENLKTRCGWSPFEGITFPGGVEAVFVGGQRVG